jgi:hypothetical protein
MLQVASCGMATSAPKEQVIDMKRILSIILSRIVTRSEF